MASGEELVRYFAKTMNGALNAMARTAGFDDYADVCGRLPGFKEQILITEL